MTIISLRKLPSFWLVTFFILQVSCTVTREYPFMNRSCIHCDSFPVYYADKYDQLVFMQKFQDGRQYCNKLAAVKKNEKWGFMDRNGNVIIPMMYDWVSCFGEYGFHKSLAMAKIGTDQDRMPILTPCSTVLINQKGDTITPIYCIIFPIEKKLSIVNNGLQLQSVGKSFAVSDGKWGCINDKGTEVVKCQYDLIYPFREKITFVQKSGKWGMIDEKGREVIPCIYDDVCYKSNCQTIDTQFDIAPTTVLKKTIIPYQQNGIIYMFQQNRIYSFSSDGNILNINNLSNH